MGRRRYSMVHIRRVERKGRRGVLEAFVGV